MTSQSDSDRRGRWPGRSEVMEAKSGGRVVEMAAFLKAGLCGCIRGVGKSIGEQEFGENRFDPDTDSDTDPEGGNGTSSAICPSCRAACRHHAQGRHWCEAQERRSGSVSVSESVSRIGALQCECGLSSEAQWLGGLGGVSENGFDSHTDSDRAFLPPFFGHASTTGRTPLAWQVFPDRWPARLNRFKIAAWETLTPWFSGADLGGFAKARRCERWFRKRG